METIQRLTFAAFITIALFILKSLPTMYTSVPFGVNIASQRPIETLQ
jgi:hypothetical protein